MAATLCPPGQYTDIPATGGDMLLSCGRGAWVCLDGTKSLTSMKGNHWLANGDSMVVASGIAVSVFPTGPLPLTATSNPI